MIPKSIVKIAGREGISGIYLEADLSRYQEIKNFVCQIFDEKWENACLEVEKQYGNCYEYTNAWPSGIDVYPWNRGLFLTFPALYISFDTGKKCDTKLGIETLKNTLEKVTKEYPGTFYYGLVAFVDLDNHMVQRTFYSQGEKCPKKLEFIEKIVEYINQNKDSFIDCVLDNCYEVEDEDSGGKWVDELFDFLHMYEDKIDFSIYDQILSVACEYIEDDNIYDAFEEKIEAWKKASGYVNPIVNDENEFLGADKYRKRIPKNEG